MQVQSEKSNFLVNIDCSKSKNFNFSSGNSVVEKYVKKG